MESLKMKCLRMNCVSLTLKKTAFAWSAFNMSKRGARAAYRTTANASLADNPILAAVAVDIVDDSTGRRHLAVGAREPRRAHTHVVPACALQ